MARRSRSNGIGELIVLAFAGMVAALGAVVKFVKDNAVFYNNTSSISQCFCYIFDHLLHY